MPGGGGGMSVPDVSYDDDDDGDIIEQRPGGSENALSMRVCIVARLRGWGSGGGLIE